MRSAGNIRHRWCMALFVPVFYLVGCSKASNPWEHVPGGPTRVLVTIPPLYCFTKAVAGDDAAVLCLLNAQGPHGYEPTFNDSLKARHADLFLLVGLELDDFADRVVNASGNHKVRLIPVAEKAIPKKLLLASGEHDHHEMEEGGHEHHHHGENDPHVWLGIPQSIRMVEFIRDTLQQADPSKKDAFAHRAADYIKKLQDLQQHGQTALAGKKNRKLIATHDALRYFGDSFKLEILDSIQPRPGIEADSGKLMKLIKLCAKENVRVIAKEPQYSPVRAENLSSQLRRMGTEVTLIDVDPMETAAEGDLEPAYYLRKMRQNIDEVAKALP